MNPSTLMLNNIIQDADGIGQVTGIDGEDVKTTSNDLWLPWECYEPVPITPEWLLKLGFSYNFTRTYWDTWSTPNNFYVSFCLRDVPGRYSLGDIIAGPAETKVSYIHTVQNLFALLSGTELKLNQQI